VPATLEVVAQAAGRVRVAADPFEQIDRKRVEVWLAGLMATASIMLAAGVPKAQEGPNPLAAPGRRRADARAGGGRRSSSKV
jgi:hypothetical protein